VSTWIEKSLLIGPQQRKGKSVQNIQLTRGTISYAGRAILQRGGGTPAISKSFFADNGSSPGDYTTNAFADWPAVITAMDGGIPDTAYAGTVPPT